MGSGNGQRRCHGTADSYVLTSSGTGLPPGRHVERLGLSCATQGGSVEETIERHERCTSWTDLRRCLQL